MLPKTGVSGNAGHICVPSVVRFSVSNHLIYFIKNKQLKKLGLKEGAGVAKESKGLAFSELF